MGKVKDTVTGLMRVSTKEFGSHLLKAAQDGNTEDLRKATIGRVQEILMQIQKQRDYREQCDRNIALLEEQVTAIKAGAFTLANYGGEFGRLTFTDADLNDNVVSMGECLNCGYDRKKTQGLR